MSAPPPHTAPIPVSSSAADLPPPHGLNGSGNGWVGSGTDAIREAVAPPRLMMYSQDGLGLGHMRRTSEIAAELSRRRPDAAILAINDSPLGNIFGAGKNHDYVKLPSIEKVGPGDWRGVSLPLPFDDIRAMRERILWSSVLHYRPDVLLVDHMPHGAMSELVPALEALREAKPEATIVLGLRDILDAPDVISRRWKAEGAFEVIERFYDQILVYGSRDVFDMAAQYRFPPGTASKLRYCGYLCTAATGRSAARIRATHRKGMKDNGRLIVAMAGGGADAFSMMDTLVAAVPEILSRHAVNLVLVTGPLMPAADRRALAVQAAGLPVRVRASVADPLSYVEAADLVVTRAGYNSTIEILRSGTPALLVPRPGPSAEQRTRARLFANRGWIDAVDPDELDAERLAHAVVAALRQRQPLMDGDAPDLGGLESAGRHLKAVLPSELSERVPLLATGAG